ncbi:MAG: hypothetical protein ACI9H8_002493 [Lysobacterales bacterium]|jgi:hypothetical protein
MASAGPGDYDQPDSNLEAGMSDIEAEGMMHEEHWTEPADASGVLDPVLPIRPQSFRGRRFFNLIAFPVTAHLARETAPLLPLSTQHLRTLL